MPRGGRRPNSGRKKGSKNKQPRRILAIGGVHLSEVAQQYGVEMIKALVKTVRTTDSDAALVSAATSVLDRGYGKPPVQVDVSARGRVDVVYRSVAEFRQALIDRGLPASLLPPLLAPPDKETEGNDDEDP